MQLVFQKSILILLFVFVCSFAKGQQKDTTTIRNLSEVNVTEKVVRPLIIRDGAPLQAINRSSIERLGLQDLAEAIRRFYGASIKDYGGIGGLKTISVRSLGAQHTAVSYDGVTVSNTQSGQVDISRFSLDNVETVSLSIGQSDRIFQTARMYASAGALSIETQKPDFTDRPYHIKGQVKTGTFGFINPFLRYEQKISNQYAASFHTAWLSADSQYPFTFTNGNIVTKEKRKNSDIKSLRSELNLYADWKKNGNLRLKGYWFDSKRGLPGSVILYNDYHKERLKDKNGFIQALYENQFNKYFTFKGQAKFDYAWTRYQDFHSGYQNGEQKDVYTQREYYLSAASLYKPSQFISFSLAQDFFVNTLDATTPKCPFPTRYTSLTALAAQYKDSRLTITGSLLNTYLTEELEIGEAAKDRKRLSPAVSASYRLFSSQNIRLRASYQDIFRNPTFNDLYYDRIGNKELESEKATQYNVGLTWSGSIPALSLNYLSLTTDAYYNRVKDKIVALPTMFIWRMMNMGRVNIYGLNLSLSSEIVLSHNMFLQINTIYNWQDATDATDKESKIYGHQIPYTPVHSGNITVSFENPWLNISWLMEAVGERYSLPQNMEENRVDGYVEQQLSFNRSFQVKKCLIRLNAEIINLGNITYDVIRYYPMLGRSFRAGVQITY